MARSAAAELEAAQRAAWSWEDLAVWADALQDLADPRGERIAIDVAPATGESWRGRRRAILAAWLGSDRVGDFAPFVQHGFVHEARFGAYPPGLLASPLGAVVRGFSVIGDASRVTAALDELAAAPRPWLSRLAITYTGEAPLPDAVADRAIAATPALVELAVYGEPVFAAFAHPALRTLSFERRAEVSVPAAVQGRVIARPTIARDLDLLLDLVDATPDCNQLFATYAELFETPVPALLAQLAASGLVALDGPLARLATSARAPAPSTPPVVPPDPHLDAALVVYVDNEIGARLGAQAHHVALVRACRDVLPLTGAAQRALDRYLDDCARADTRYAGTVEIASIPGLRTAMNALVELHAMWPAIVRGAPGWTGIAELATVLATAPGHSHVALSRHWHPDDL